MLCGAYLADKHKKYCAEDQVHSVLLAFVSGNVYVEIVGPLPAFSCYIAVLSHSSTFALYYTCFTYLTLACRLVAYCKTSLRLAFAFTFLLWEQNDDVCLCFQLQTNWKKLLNYYNLAQKCHFWPIMEDEGNHMLQPLHSEIFAKHESVKIKLCLGYFIVSYINFYFITWMHSSPVIRNRIRMAFVGLGKGKMCFQIQFHEFLLKSF